jgi:hypothetical protein
MRARLLLAAVPLLVACGQNAGAQGPARTAAPAATPGDTVVNADAAVLEDFQHRIAAYMDIHKKAAGDGAKVEESSDPAKIMAAQDGLAKRIRAARADAKPGDIFAPDIRTRFRQLLNPQLKGEDGQDAKAVLKDDAPPAAPLLKVNSTYSAESFPSVPSKLLLNLPRLPDDLEYRIVGKHLILLDVDANMIVDYMLNVMK